MVLQKHPNILHNKYILIMRLFNTFTLGFTVSYGSPIDVKLSGKLPIIMRNLENIPQFDKDKQKDVTI